MMNNRINRYLPRHDAQPQSSRPASQKPAPQNTVNLPPGNFVPVPTSMLAHVSHEELAWHQELYRLAYQAAQASVAAARAANQSLWN